MASNNNSYDPTEDMAIIEVGKVLEAVRDYGAYSSVIFDEPVTQAVIVRFYGGWVRFCHECDAAGFRQEFVRIWMAYFRKDVKQFGHLPGIFESTNRSNGHYQHIPPPKLIGDPAKAHAVLEAAKQNMPTAGKPDLKPGIRGHALVEYPACQDEVDALLDQGYNLAHVDYRKEQGRLTCRSQVFRHNEIQERDME